MNAIQVSRPLKQPVEPRRRVARRGKTQARQNPTVAIAAETIAKLAVNLVMSVVAVSALGQLLPYQGSQQHKLREIRAEVKVTENRVNGLQTDFSRYFDPTQEKNVMQEQSYRVDPNQIQIVWTDKKQPTSTPEPDEMP